MRSLGCLALLVGCAGPQHVAPDPTLPPLVRTVRYWFDSSAYGHGLPTNVKPVCTSLVLAERVTSRTKDRELAIDIDVTDGNDKELCGVGATVHVLLRNDKLAVDAPPGTPSVVTERISWLHGKLGTDEGAFALRGAPLLAGGRSTPVTLDGIAYIDVRHGSQEHFGDYPSSGDTSEARWVRRRAADEQVVCARYSSETQAVNFEYGGWRSSITEGLQVNYGDGKPNCTEIRP